MSPEELGPLLDSLPEGVVVLGLDGLVRSANAAARRALGGLGEDLAGRPFPSLLADPDPGLSEYLRLCARSSDPLPGAFSLRLSEGGVQRHWCRGAALRLQGSPGGILLRFGPRERDGDPFVLLTQKIQELNEEVLLRRRSEQEVRTLNQELEERVRRRTAELQDAVTGLNDFAYSISHDLKAPLRTIHRYTQLILEDYAGKPLDDEGVDYLRTVLRSAVAMNQLIEDLLAYSRLSRVQISLRPIDVEPIVRSVLDTLAMDIREAGAEVKVEPGLPRVVGDNVLLSQALGNLVSNALKFRNPGTAPRVRIGAETSGDRVRLFVEDRGIGIPSQYADRLFRMFERLEPQTFPGTGVGLALVRKAAERMQGQAAFSSTPGLGSRFWIDLPSGDAP